VIGSLSAKTVREVAVGAALVIGIALLAVASPSAAASHHATTQNATSTAPQQVPLSELAYDLVAADGAVASFGGAGNFGGAEKLHLSAPIVGMAVTPDGRGYWLVGQDGGVFTYGDARFYGSLGGVAHTSAHDVIGLVPTKDGKGYWLCDASGIVTAFGDARKIPSLLPFKARLPIVGFATMRSGAGAWVVNTNGAVFHLGGSVLYGNLRSKTGGAPIVGMARAPNSKGYWLVNAKGDVTGFGSASPGVPPPAILAKKGPVVGMTAAPSTGYWAVASSGYVVPGGVPSRGGLTRRSGSTAIVGIAAATPLPASGGGPYPAGTVGYDINWPQCASPGSSAAGPLPGPPNYPAGTSAYTISVIGVDGWAVDDYNPCLTPEVAWGAKATLPGGKPAPHYQLYLFLNSPASTSTIDKSGPAGTCADLASSARPPCLAYNYGYNAALDAVSYAKSQGATATRWWLDIENDQCASGEWNDAAAGEWWSCEQKLNDETIQGALDALRNAKLIAGVYSTAFQWDAITGTYSPSGGTLPIWVAGAPWSSPPYPSSSGYGGTSALQPWCSGKYDFGGGTVQMLQETPGSNNYPYDPDYAC
jgi:hypothetical protein